MCESVRKREREKEREGFKWRQGNNGEEIVTSACLITPQLQSVKHLSPLRSCVCVYTSVSVKAPSLS